MEPTDTERIAFLEAHPECDLLYRRGLRGVLWTIYDLNAGDERAQRIGAGATFREALDKAIEKDRE